MRGCGGEEVSMCTCDEVLRCGGVEVCVWSLGHDA